MSQVLKKLEIENCIFSSVSSLTFQQQQQFCLVIAVKRSGQFTLSSKQQVQINLRFSRLKY
jgi:hypothetical protein